MPTVYTYLLFLFIMAITPAFADSQADKILALKLLQQAMANYADKHEICYTQKQQNKLSDSSIKILQSIDEDTLRKGIMYLNEKAFNHCLQPERGLLAERLLSIQSWPEDKDKLFDKVMLGTMETTRKLTFDLSVVNSEVIFYQLPQAQQTKLLKISEMNKPFNLVLFWEVYLQSKLINKE